MDPVAYVAEDGLVGHQWGGAVIGPESDRHLSVRECQGRKTGVGGRGERIGWSWLRLLVECLPKIHRSLNLSLSAPQNACGGAWL